MLFVVVSVAEVLYVPSYVFYLPEDIANVTIKKNRKKEWNKTCHNHYISVVSFLYVYEGINIFDSAKKWLPHLHGF